MTLWRTVAIWGLWFCVRIVAMMFPPKAGRVWRSSLVAGSMASSVQSAVSPVRMRAATRGRSERPTTVPPPRKTSGLRSRRICATRSACTSSSKSPMPGSSIIHTSSTPYARSSRCRRAPRAHQDGAHGGRSSFCSSRPPPMISGTTEASFRRLCSANTQMPEYSLRFWPLKVERVMTMAL